MSRCIVVPLEGNERDANSLDIARQVAPRISAAVVLVHVAPMMVTASDVVAVEQRLDEYTQALRAEGIEAHFLMGYGDPAATVAEVARKQRADLVVLAPEHRAFLETLWHPRVSQRILGRARSSLLILPEVNEDHPATGLLDHSGAQVIVALDGSENAEAALPFASFFAQVYQRPLLLVRVIPPVFLLGTGVEALETQRVARHVEEAEAHRYLVETRKRLVAETHLSVEAMQLNGLVADQLVQLVASRRGSLLVMGTHGHTGLARVLMGSVAAEMFNRSIAPLVIVPSQYAAVS